MPKLSSTKLTKRSVEATKAPATGETFVWDAEVKGFGVRVYASGRRIFVFQYSAPTTAKTRRLTLGEFGSITTDHARSLAQRAASKVADGIDPQGDDADAMMRQTMSAVMPLYLEERASKLAPSTAAERQRVWTRSLEPVFGSKPVAAVDESMIARWHSARRANPVAANAEVKTLHTFFEWAERRGYRAKHTNPCPHVERYPEERRGRSLTADEYARLGAALSVAGFVGLPVASALRDKTSGVAKDRQAKQTNATRGAYKKRALQLMPARADLVPANPVTLAALRFLVLSGWRENEALSLRWDAINFERGVVILQNTKSGRSERPLGRVALDLIAAQGRQGDNPYVFPGERAGSHLAEPKHVWLSVKEAAGLETTAPLRLHDLRHSFTTCARDEMGLGDHAIARLVGHRLSGQTSRYGEVREQTVKSAADAISGLIARYLEGGDTKVLTFAPRAASA